MELSQFTKLEEPFKTLCASLRPFFKRPEAFTHAQTYLRGLLLAPKARNCWTLAETAGEASPDGVQRLLSRSVWDAEAVRCQMEGQIYRELASDQTYWDLDETGFLKSGRHSVGTQRQYTGTAGKQTNCQVVVFLAVSSTKGYALTDFRLFVPRQWAQAPDRCRHAKLPDDVAHRTKGQLAVELLSAARARGYSADWTTGDSVYGDSPDLRQFLVAQAQAFVLAMHPDRLFQPAKASEPVLILQAHHQVESWHRLALPGSQGWIRGDWGLLEGTYQGHPCWLVFRKRGEEVTSYLAWSPHPFTLAAVARAICRRWDVERCFEEAKQEVGLGEYQVRKWPSLQRHLVLALQAFWFLVQLKRWQRTTLPLARRLFNLLAVPLEPLHRLLWTRYREWHSLKTSLFKWKQRLKAATQAEGA